MPGVLHSKPHRRNRRCQDWQSAAVRTATQRNRPGREAFSRQENEYGEMGTVMTMFPNNKPGRLDDEPEPKTAFLLGLAVGAVLPLLVLAVS